MNNKSVILIILGVLFAKISCGQSLDTTQIPHRYIYGNDFLLLDTCYKELLISFGVGFDNHLVKLYKDEDLIFSDTISTDHSLDLAGRVIVDNKRISNYVILIEKSGKVYRNSFEAQRCFAELDIWFWKNNLNLNYDNEIHIRE